MSCVHNFAYDERDGGSRCTRCDERFAASVPFPPQRRPQQPANEQTDDSTEAA